MTDIRAQIAEIVEDSWGLVSKADRWESSAQVADHILALIGEPVAYETSIDTPTGRYVEFWSAANSLRAMSQFEEWLALEPDANPQIRPLYALGGSDDDA